MNVNNNLSEANRNRLLKIRGYYQA